MEYVLMIWTAVAAAGGGGAGGVHRVEYDWRPIATFPYSSPSSSSALERCQTAARDLNIKATHFRCIRIK